MNRKQNIIIALLVVIIVILISPALIFAAVYNSSMKQMALHPVPTARRPQTVEEVTEAIDLACKKSFGTDYELITDYENGIVQVNSWHEGVDAELIARAKESQDLRAWNAMAADVNSTTSSMQRQYTDAGFDEITVVTNICDWNHHEITYLTAANGIVGYDAVNGIDMRAG